MHEARLGDRVQVQFCRILAFHAAADKRGHPKTWEFTVGSSEVFATLSFGVIGMVPGDRKRLTLQPVEAYGNVQRELIRPISRQRIPKHLDLKVGKRLTAVQRLAGRRQRVTVVEIRSDSVIVDGNHPLAGMVIELEVMLISLDSSSDANRSKPQFDRGGEA